MVSRVQRIRLVERGFLRRVRVRARVVEIALELVQVFDLRRRLFRFGSFRWWNEGRSETTMDVERKAGGRSCDRLTFPRTRRDDATTGPGGSEVDVGAGLACKEVHTRQV